METDGVDCGVGSGSRSREKPSRECSGEGAQSCKRTVESDGGITEDLIPPRTQEESLVSGRGRGSSDGYRSGQIGGGGVGLGLGYGVGARKVF